MKNQPNPPNPTNQDEVVFESEPAVHIYGKGVVPPREDQDGSLCGESDPAVTFGVTWNWREDPSPPRA